MSVEALKFMCGLDAEGAFDGIPHPVLFQKSYGVISEMCYKLLVHWYNVITVQVKWKTLSSPIQVCKGTRQGGLSSPFLFNLFYKDLVDILSQHEGGVTIGNIRYNIVCYADDLLLLSSTITGLQKLIETSNQYITNYGLSFNPSKTKCSMKGKLPFSIHPKWFLNGVELMFNDHINYLGGVLGNDCGKMHSISRISSCRKSFFALQSVGLCAKGLSLEAATYIWSTTCNSILTYACNAIYLNKGNKQDIDKLQAKLLKCIVGLKPFYKTTKLLQALKVNKASVLIDFGNISLLNNILQTKSAARDFYLYMMQHGNESKDILTSRVKKICIDNNINMYKCLLDSNYYSFVKKQMCSSPKQHEDGYIDTLRMLLKDRNEENMTFY